MSHRVIPAAVAALAFSAFLAASAAHAARPGAAPPPPARVEAAPEEEALPQSREEGGPGWWQRFRLSMAAKNYGLTEEQALEMQRIVGDQDREKERLADENRALINSLEDPTNKDAAKITEILAKVSANRTAMATADNAAQDRIVALLGPERAAEWFLARRSMVDRARSSFNRGRQEAAERNTQSTTTEVRGNPARSR